MAVELNDANVKHILEGGEGVIEPKNKPASRDSAFKFDEFCVAYGNVAIKLAGMASLLRRRESIVDLFKKDTLKLGATVYKLPENRNNPGPNDWTAGRFESFIRYRICLKAESDKELAKTSIEILQDTPLAYIYGLKSMPINDTDDMKLIACFSLRLNHLASMPKTCRHAMAVAIYRYHCKDMVRKEFHDTETLERVCTVAKATGFVFDEDFYRIVLKFRNAKIISTGAQAVMEYHGSIKKAIESLGGTFNYTPSHRTIRGAEGGSSDS
ncbi:nucleocapsid protein [Lisianthus necrotic ringspot virus]|uniref:Nucleoprotein n=1 Tax=Lisianthus necrotic ringspot virus TaxID=1398661 RepID=T2HV97_9VIRU|nr:nucleocapsid protein [Lisianthus necrotic ringspot virus]BAN83764.1 N [Lisianthus necrotic ringspot virus] [Lisianthus necrotic ringspot virus]